MSRASKLTLAGTTCLAIGSILFVHHAQRAEKALMEAGVVRDLENQRAKKERQMDFDMQRQLEQQYLKEQSVSSDHKVAKPVPPTAQPKEAPAQTRA